MFTEVLFILAKMWKQPKCLLSDEWLNKMWYILSAKNYSTMERDEALIYVST